MKTLLHLAAFALIFAPASAFANSAVGTWKSEPNERGHIEIEIAPCGSALCGTIVRAVAIDGTLGTKADFRHLGRKMVWDMKPDGPDQWAGGKIFDPNREKTFNSKMQVTAAGLKVSGCVLGVCQSQLWRAVK